MTICLMYDSRCPFNCPLPTPVVCSSKLRIIKPDRSPLSAWQRVVLGPWRESNLLVLLLKLPTEASLCCSTTEKRCAATAYINIYVVCKCQRRPGIAATSLPLYLCFSVVVFFSLYLSKTSL